MRILFLTQIIPFPPDAGPRVKTWHVLRALKRFGHRITLVSFVREDEEKHVERLYENCEEVYAVPIKRSLGSDLKYWLRSHFTGRPFIIERDDRAEMRAQVFELVTTGVYDTIHADQVSMAQFAFPPEPAPRSDGRPLARWPHTVFDAHNAVWTILDRLAGTAPAWQKPLVSLEKKRIKRLEGSLIRQFDLTLAVSEPDRLALLEAAGRPNDRYRPNVAVVPIAVDTQELVPASRKPSSTDILTLGSLHYPPNADGIRWFVNSVFPKIQQELPNVTLTIVGKNPPKDFRMIAARSPESIQVTGYVPDLDPLFERASVFVVPVRAGGGMRVRILEAFARGMPVVTTTLGLEGIAAEHCKHVILADDPQSFADWVLKVIADPKLQKDLSCQARELAVETYDWRIVLSRLGKIYNDLNKMDLEHPEMANITGHDS